MKISYNWLKRYINVDLPAEEVGHLLTFCGLEVEDIITAESVKGGLKGVVIGHVLECTKHPNADKLSLTKVDIGTGRPLSIVCGAPNVAVGQKVPVATVGTLLWSGDKSFEIKEAKIRGEFSEGMICAEDELGLGSSHEGIMVLGPDTPIGMTAAEYFGISSDQVFEIGLTPNRTDAMSHTGVARDLVAVLNRRAGQKKYQLEWPSVDAYKVDSLSLPVEVIVEDQKACPRYSGVTISGVSIGESPSWLKDLLSAAGIRPINNVVDVTNFVMMELGQPLHAFDAAMIHGNKVVVRKAYKDELFVTLDETERKLSTDDLMICNSTEGMCIAGVFGGANSGVSSSTRDIFLESAYFNPQSVRKTSKYHTLQTDSSFRFERGADPNITVYALKRAAMMIKELAGGEIASNIADIYPEQILPVAFPVRWNIIDRLIGKKIGHDIIKSILDDLGMEILQELEDGIQIAVPTFKNDVTREADVIEEILRIYGYDNIEMTSQLRASLSFANKPDPERMRNLVSDLLSSRGFLEIMNNSLTRARYTDESPWLDPATLVKLMNPLSSDLNVMRQTLLFGGLETLAYNQNRKAGNLRLYEFGRVYVKTGAPAKDANALPGYDEQEHLALWITGNSEPESWRTTERKTDFFDLKESVHLLLLRLGFDLGQITKVTFSDLLFHEGLTYSIGGKTIVKFGQLQKNEIKRFDLKQDVFYADFIWDTLMEWIGKNKTTYSGVPKFPEVRRDLALVLDQSVSYEELEEAAYQAGTSLLKAVSLFDIYQGEKIGAGKKSYAMSFLLRDEEKTLTDQVIEKTMDKILKVFQEKFQASIR